MREAEFDKDPHLKEFGIRVSTNMTNLEGRVLDLPNMKCSDERSVCHVRPNLRSLSHLILSLQVVPREGTWDRDMRGKRFVRGVNVSKWAVLLLTGDVAIQYVSVSHACHMTVYLDKMILLLLNIVFFL